MDFFQLAMGLHKKIRKKLKEPNNFLMGFIGTKDAGRHSVALKFAEEWRNSKYILNKKNKTHVRYKIISFDPNRVFKNISDIVIDHSDRDWAKKLLQLQPRNTLLIIDDYGIINPYLLADGFSELIFYRDVYNIDIMYLCDKPSHILSPLTYLTTHYYIFYTKVRDRIFSKKLFSYQLLKCASIFVNEYISLWRNKSHSRSRSFPEQSPYIIIDTKKGTLSAFNAKQKNIIRSIDLNNNGKK